MSNETGPVVEQLRTEYHENAIGLGVTKPRFGWRVRPIAGRQGLAQSAYQITIGTAPGLSDLWDSGKTASNNSTHVDYAGKALVTAQRAHWRVRVWDEQDRAGAWSSDAFFEIGLLSEADWSGAKWIGGELTGGPATSAPSPYLRRAFDLAGKQIASARLYASALGLYEFHINGSRVGHDVFTPGWTDYRKRVQYQAYDVTSLLKGGANVVGAILGDGWYAGFVGYRGSRQQRGDRPWLLARLVVRFTDGSSETLVTDNAWRVTYTGPILASDMQMGEAYDARRELDGWLDSTFNASSWQNAIVNAEAPAIPLVATSGTLVRAAETLKPISIRKSQGGFLVDFGQNLVGRPRLCVRNAEAGKTITLRFGEILDKGATGELYTDNLRAAKQTDTYTTRGGAEEVFEPRFTFHGYRYCHVRGYPGELTTDDFSSIVLHSDMKRTGDFACSEPLLNQLQHNIVWGQKGNFLEAPTDCPQRDERLGWTGDAQVFVRTAAFNFDVAPFFTKWAIDLRDAQGQLGSYPHVVPNVDDVNLKDGIEWQADGGPAWADAGVICPWTVWRCYGDKRLIETHYASMQRYLARLQETAEPFGLIRSHPKWNGWHGFGDWLATDSGRDNVFGMTPKDLIGTAFFVYCSRLVAQMADELAKPADAEKYRALADKVTQAFLRRFVTPDGLIVGATQTSYVLALHFDLLPEALRPAAIEELVRLIEKNGTHLSTGFVGTPYLLHVLSRFGRLDVAYKLLLQKTYPSWLYPVTLGATTIWERWDGWTEQRGFQSTGMNSFNHYAYGAVGDWMYRVVAGIDTLSSGYQHLSLRPQPGGGLTQASASLETMYGTVKSAWKIDGDQITWEIEIPPNARATAHVPSTDPSQTAAKELGAGTYRFTAPWAPTAGK